MPAARCSDCGRSYNPARDACPACARRPPEPEGPTRSDPATGWRLGVIAAGMAGAGALGVLAWLGQPHGNADMAIVAGAGFVGFMLGAGGLAVLASIVSTRQKAPSATERLARRPVKRTGKPPVVPVAKAVKKAIPVAKAVTTKKRELVESGSS
jgi:hypothetical protein